MDVTISSASTEEGDLFPPPKSKGKIGLVRKLTKGGPSKLFLMKNKKASNPKGSKVRQSGSCRGLRYQAGVAASDVLQEDEETAAGGWKKRSYSENPSSSPWATSPGIDEAAFEDNTASGSGDSRYAGEEKEEMRPRSSLNLNGSPPETTGQSSLSNKVPVKRKIKPRKEARQKSERQRKEPKGSSVTWGSLICVKKNRKNRVNEVEERSPNYGLVSHPETKGESQRHGCLAAPVSEAQSEDSAGSGNRTEGPGWNLSLSRSSGLSAQVEEDANESSVATVEGEPEVCRSDSRGKLRRKSSGWASFRYLMKSKKEWRSFAERNMDFSGSQSQQGESAETGMLQDSQESEVTTLSNSKLPLKEQIRGQKKEVESPRKGPERTAEPGSRILRDSEILHPETVGPSLNRDQALQSPGVSKSCQPEIHAKTGERAGVGGILPATLQDQVGLSEDNGQAMWVNGMKESDQHSCDFGLMPSELMLSLQTTPQGQQCDIGTERMNPSHTPETLQKRFIQAVITESERLGLAKGNPEEPEPSLMGSGDLQKPSTVLVQSTQLPKGEKLPEPLTIEEPQETPTQEPGKHDSSNELKSKNANPVCYYPKHDTERAQGSQESTNGTMLDIIEQEALSERMNVELHSTAAPDPSCFSTHRSSCSEEDASCECRVREWANWNRLSEDRRCECDGEWEGDPLSDVVAGLQLPGLYGGPEMQEAVLVQTASCIVQSAMRAAVEQVAGETTMKHVPENPPTAEILDSE
ncbi:uncharacterized protein LOC144693527 [Cetorhinus maximus]